MSTTQSTNRTDSASGLRATEAIEPQRSVASDAERIANMPGNAAARRRAWSRFLLERDAEAVYMTVFVAAIAVSLVTR
jgi:hypothetical protein